jgi:hypothetical protein
VVAYIDGERNRTPTYLLSMLPLPMITMPAVTIAVTPMNKVMP